MVQCQPMIRERDLKLAIEREKRFQQVLFVQRESPLQQPLGGIIVREEDVVHVHPHAGPEFGQHFEKLVTDVAAELHRVARIDEENVVRFELRKEPDVDLAW